MAYAGQMLDNPISGERIVFRKTTTDTGGELRAGVSMSDTSGFPPSFLPSKTGLTIDAR
jgi:hypothetical protein